MQLTFRIDDNNFLTVNVRISDAGASEYQDGPEVSAAVISDQKLSDIEASQLLDVVGQVVDHLTAADKPAPPSNDDWRAKFRSGKL